MEIKPNSYSYKDRVIKEGDTQAVAKKVESVAKGRVVKKKKSGLTKLTDAFVAEDASNVKDFVLMGVLVPAVKKAIRDIVTDGINMILYGDTSHSSKKSKASGISYRDYYSSDRDSRDYDRPVRRDSMNCVICVDTKEEANEILYRLEELVDPDAYGVASVADAYDLGGIPHAYTDERYGWDDLRDIRNTKVVRVNDGWEIRFPRVKVIKSSIR